MSHWGLNDEIILSLLTISMIVVVTQLYKLPLEVSAALAALCCFAAFYLGTLGGKWLTASQIPWLTAYSNEITTFVVTEIMGWATTLIAAKRK
jgi:Flp pilus assembly protein protease CpaA